MNELERDLHAFQFLSKNIEKQKSWSKSADQEKKTFFFPDRARVRPPSLTSLF